MRSFTAKEHTASVLALCLSVFTQSYLLISVFPYSGYMAIDLLEGVNGENVGSYAGLLASSFMLGRALTSYGWGKLADRYGRVPVLQASLVLSLVFSFLFGLSTSFALALLIRFFLGIGSGILIVAKVSASELACGNQVLETKGMGMVMGMWAMGYMIAPAISGALAEPTRQYPDHVRSVFLAEFPFFLPNLVGAILPHVYPHCSRLRERDSTRGQASTFQTPTE
jgi:MFS family permease